MPAPSPAPVPVLLVNGTSWLEVTTQIVIPVMSLLVAAAAIWHSHVTQRRRETKETAERRRAARQAFAPQLRTFGRNFREGRPSSGAKFLDEWNEVIAGAPDEAARRLVGWALLQYGQLDGAFFRRPDRELMREGALVELQFDFESRVRAWQESGEADLGPHLGQSRWPVWPVENDEPVVDQDTRD